MGFALAAAAGLLCNFQILLVDLGKVTEVPLRTLPSLPVPSVAQWARLEYGAVCLDFKKGPEMPCSLYCIKNLIFW